MNTCFIWYLPHKTFGFVDNWPPNSSYARVTRGANLRCLTKPLPNSHFCVAKVRGARVVAASFVAEGWQGKAAPNSSVARVVAASSHRALISLLLRKSARNRPYHNSSYARVRPPQLEQSSS